MAGTGIQDFGWQDTSPPIDIRLTSAKWLLGLGFLISVKLYAMKTSIRCTPVEAIPHIYELFPTPAFYLLASSLGTQLLVGFHLDKGQERLAGPGIQLDSIFVRGQAHLESEEFDPYNTHRASAGIAVPHTPRKLIEPCALQ